MRHKSRGRELAELQLGLEAEKSRRPADERRPRGHRHIARLDALDDIVFLTLVCQLEVLGVEIECGVRVIAHVELHSVADRRVDGGLDFLVEVEIGLAPRRQRQRRIVSLVALDAHLHLHRPLRLELDAARPEYLLKRPEGEIHVEDIERLFLLVGDKLLIARAIVLLHRQAELPVVVLLGREHERRGDVEIAHSRMHDIRPRGRVVLRLRAYVRRRREVVGKLVFHQLLIILRHGLEHREGHHNRIRGRSRRISPRSRRLELAFVVLGRSPRDKPHHHKRHHKDASAATEAAVECRIIFPVSFLKLHCRNGARSRGHSCWGREDRRRAQGRGA